jgi:hypothetical protein
VVRPGRSELSNVGDRGRPTVRAGGTEAGGGGFGQAPVSADGIQHKSKDELHGYWDTQFVDAIAGKSPPALAKQLIAQIAPDQATLWVAGSFDEWAMEAFMISKKDVYGDRRCPRTGHIISTPTMLRKPRRTLRNS